VGLLCAFFLCFGVILLGPSTLKC